MNLEVQRILPFGNGVLILALRWHLISYISRSDMIAFQRFGSQRWSSSLQTRLARSTATQPKPTPTPHSRNKRKITPKKTRRIHELGNFLHNRDHISRGASYTILQRILRKYIRKKRHYKLRNKYKIRNY
jgi:hypothetical protein